MKQRKTRNVQAENFFFFTNALFIHTSTNTLGTLTLIKFTYTNTVFEFYKVAKYIISQSLIFQRITVQIDVLLNVCYC